MVTHLNYYAEMYIILLRTKYDYMSDNFSRNNFRTIRTLVARTLLYVKSNHFIPYFFS